MSIEKLSLREKVIEKFSNIESLDIDEASRERLVRIVEEQNDSPEHPGKRFIFAPNHLTPQEEWRNGLALADDFPVLNKVLREAGIVDNFPVARDDADMKVEGPVSKAVYKAHRAVFSKVGQTVAGSLPMSINSEASSVTKEQNVGNVLDLARVLREKEGNITMYPYGNWYASGEQDFSDDVSLRGDVFMPQVDKGEPGYEEWRASLKRGAFALSWMTGSPVVPVYVENGDGNWVIRIGEPITAPTDVPGTTEKEQHGEMERAMAHEYLEQMQAMQASLHPAEKENPPEERAEGKEEA